MRSAKHDVRIISDHKIFKWNLTFYFSYRESIWAALCVPKCGVRNQEQVERITEKYNEYKNSDNELEYWKAISYRLKRPTVNETNGDRNDENVDA